MQKLGIQEPVHTLVHPILLLPAADIRDRNSDRYSLYLIKDYGPCLKISVALHALPIIFSAGL